MLAFDLWHVARTQDWALQTFVRGAPELIDEPRWQGRGRLTTHGIGVGWSEEQADEFARNLKLASVLEYADAVHQSILMWLQSIPDEELSQEPDVATQLKRYPVYLEPAMREEVPWMFQRPQVWRCLSPALLHTRDHLVVAALLKRQRRASS